MAVSLTAPAVFNFTAPSAPQRHREALAVFAPGAAEVSDADVGQALGDAIRVFLDGLGVPRGLGAVGYASGDVARVRLAKKTN